MLTNMTNLKACLLANIQANIPTMVWGPPGVGKSDIFRQIAKDNSMSHIDFRATLRDPVDMRGLPMIDSKTGLTRWLPPAELPDEKRHGKKGLLVMDELPQASDSMQKACFSLALERFIGEYKLPDGWVVMAAGNRLSDRSGASRMLKALANRFAHFEVEAELDAWTAWANTAGISPYVIGFLRFRPTFLHKMPEGDDNSFPTPRAWEKVSKIADTKDEGLRLALVSALVGEAAAIEFEGFVRTFARLPSINQIFASPQSVHVPDVQDPAVLFAVSAAIAKLTTKITIKNALTYMSRLPREFQVMCAVDMVQRDPDLKATQAFSAWLVKNQDVVI